MIPKTAAVSSIMAGNCHIYCFLFCTLCTTTQQQQRQREQAEQHITLPSETLVHRAVLDTYQLHKRSGTAFRRVRDTLSLCKVPPCNVVIIAKRHYNV